MVVSDIYLSKPVSWLRLIASVFQGREGGSGILTSPSLLCSETHSHSLSPTPSPHPQSTLAGCLRTDLLIRALSCLISDSYLLQEITEAQICDSTNS